MLTNRNSTTTATATATAVASTFRVLATGSRYDDDSDATRTLGANLTRIEALRLVDHATHTGVSAWIAQ